MTFPETINRSFYAGAHVLVTGGAGFIGSHLVEQLLQLGAKVNVLDNLQTGHLKNIKAFEGDNLQFFEGDIRRLEDCLKAAKGVNVIFHQAALGSVPRSLKDPVTSHTVNVNGFLNVLEAAKLMGVPKVVFASSSSVYGDSPQLPKKEEHVGNLLSPYAVTKSSKELYAKVFVECYGMDVIGLRYFNVFGPRQDPNGPYAAVIPLFIKYLVDGQAPTINGDGNNSRDFTYVHNVVLANLLAGQTQGQAGQLFNVAAGHRTTLNQLYETLASISKSDVKPIYGPERPGDIPHSLADISKIENALSYKPLVDVQAGLAMTWHWFMDNKDWFN